MNQHEIRARCAIRFDPCDYFLEPPAVHEKSKRSPTDSFYSEGCLTIPCAEWWVLQGTSASHNIRGLRDESRTGSEDRVGVGRIDLFGNGLSFDSLFVRQDPATSMMFSLYVTLGVFMLLAIRNPSTSRSLIAFTAWSSFAHAAVMGTQAMRNMVARGELVGVAVLVVIGVTLIALAPIKQRPTFA